MRIVKKSEFVKLPFGTPYYDWVPDTTLGPLKIKGDTCVGLNDFLYFDTSEIDHTDSVDRWDKYDKMRENGNSYPLDPESCGRDGMFDDEAMYLIYEPEDVVKLIGMLTQLNPNTDTDTDQHDRDGQTA